MRRTAGLREALYAEREMQTAEGLRERRAQWAFEFLARRAGITETRLPANWSGLSPEVKAAFTDMIAFTEDF